MPATHFKELGAYKKAFNLAMLIFEHSRQFPPEERYSLTDQIRRSSRAVCSNLAEAFRKRQYPAHFVSKVSDADAENSETQTWLEFALQCQYLDKTSWQHLYQQTEEVGKMLQHMIRNPQLY